MRALAGGRGEVRNLAMIAANLLDTAYVFDEQRNEDAEATGWSLVDTFACYLHRTPNFDEPKGHGINAKQGNLFTSDGLFYEFGKNLKPRNRVKVVTRLGDTEWFNSKGADQAVTATPMGHVFLAPDFPIPDSEVI